MNDWWIAGVTLAFAATAWLLVLLARWLEGDRR
jgi:urea transporter